MSEVESWAAAHLPHQAGRLAVVTGATSDLGFATALGLAQAGADLILATNDENSGRQALGKIRPLAPSALVRLEKLDLGSLASIAEFAARLSVAGRPIDLLINIGNGFGSGSRNGNWNKRQLTADGFERQFGENYLGHFALTARLLPLLRRSRQARVVQLSCLCHRRASIQFGDLNLTRSYHPWRAMCQSKLARLIFAMELQRRSDTLGWDLVSVAAHPGKIDIKLPAKAIGSNFAVRGLYRAIGLFVNQTAASGAQSLLFAAASPHVRRGGFYGPMGPFELAGPPASAVVGKSARDPDVARRLWQISEKLTRIAWPVE